MSYFWVHHPDLALVAAKKISKEKGLIKMISTDNEVFHVQPSEMKNAIPAQISSFNLKDNLISLEELNEGSVLHQLRSRFIKGNIYTNIGSILVSINPYKILPIFTLEYMNKYMHNTGNKILPPHIFSIADEAFFLLKNDNQDQSIIISGESGAGKTEATKLILSFLAEISDSKTNAEEQIMESNPLLEAFGNAKTIRNNNSSRFGKWVEIYFNKDNRLCGAKIINYLLEQARVVFQQENERNFHIFYQLLSCQDRNLLSKLSLSSQPQNYHILSQGHCVRCEEIQDYEAFSRTCHAMDKLNFTPRDQEYIFQILAGILHIGNLEFENDFKDMEASRISNIPVLDTVSKLLNLENKDLLETCLCFRTVTVQRSRRTSCSQVPRNAIAAKDAANTLSKHLYGHLFNWIVSRINKTFGQVQYKRMIGILDIYGFEIFETNSYEQLLINYANEKLQGFFNINLFRLEQEEYVKEGIDLTYVDFKDNSETLELLEGKLGIFSLLDEETYLLHGSDNSFMDKVLNRQSHPRFEEIRTDKASFCIIHYASKVNYNSKGFCEKNKNFIHPDISNLLQLSRNKLISFLFGGASSLARLSVSPSTPPCTPPKSSSPKNFSSPKESAHVKNISKQMEQNWSENKSSNPNSPSKAVKQTQTSLANDFIKQLNTLLNKIRVTNPFFIKCLKPNENKKGLTFNSHLVLDQLNYSGVFETIRIRKQGYSYRKPHNNFLFRYSCLFSSFKLPPYKQLSSTMDSPTIIGNFLEKLFDVHNILPENIQIGLTKVLYRYDIFRLLEKLRDGAVGHDIIKLQCLFRKIIAIRKVKKLRKFRNKCLDCFDNPQGDVIIQILNEAKQENIQIPIIHQMKDLYKYINEEDRIYELLTKALESGQLSPLRASLQQADRINLQYYCKKKEILIQYQKVLLILNDLKERSITRRWLQRSVEQEDVVELNKAIQSAEQLKIPKKDLDFYYSKLQNWQEKNEAKDAIATTLFEENFEAIGEAIQYALSVGLDPNDSDLNHAQRQFVLYECQQSMENEDIEKFKQKIKEAITVGLESKIISTLENQIPQIETRIKITKDLENCLNTNDSVVLENQLRLAFKHNCNNTLIEKASKLLNQLLVKEELEEAIQSLMIEPIENAISKAKKSNIEKNSIKKAQDFLQRLKREIVIQEKCKKSQSLEILEKNYDILLKEKIFPELQEERKVIIQEAKSRITFFLQNLAMMAMSNGDENSLKSILKRAEQNKIQEEFKEIEKNIKEFIVAVEENRKIIAEQEKKRKEEEEKRRKEEEEKKKIEEEIRLKKEEEDRIRLLEEEKKEEEEAIKNGDVLYAIRKGKAINKLKSVNKQEASSHLRKLDAQKTPLLAMLARRRTVVADEDEDDNELSKEIQTTEKNLLKAIRNRDKKEIKVLLPRLQNAGIETRTVRVATNLLITLEEEEKLINTLNEEVYKVNVEGLKPLIEKGDEMNIQNEILEEARNLCFGVSESELYRLQLIYLYSTDDFDRLASVIGKCEVIPDISKDQMLQDTLVKAQIKLNEYLYKKMEEKAQKEQEEKEKVRKEQEEKEKVRKEQEEKEEKEKFQKEQEEKEKVRKEQEEKEKIRKEQEEKVKIIDSDTPPPPSSPPPPPPPSSEEPVKPLQLHESKSSKEESIKACNIKSQKFIHNNIPKDFAWVVPPQTTEEFIDYTKHFQEIKGKFPFHCFPFLRSENNYAKRTFFSSKDLKANRLVWQRDKIPRSLYKISTLYCGGSYSLSKEVKTKAKKLFKNLLIAMCDHYHAYPASEAHTYLKWGLNEPLLRDELFLQIMKQTTQNPNTESCIRGWKLFYLALNSFSPSQELAPYVLDHITKYANPIILKYTPFNSIPNVASNCYSVQIRQKEERRKFLPQIEEIHQMFELNHPVIIIPLRIPGSTPIFRIQLNALDENTTVSDVVQVAWSMIFNKQDWITNDTICSARHFTLMLNLLEKDGRVSLSQPLELSYEVVNILSFYSTIPWAEQGKSVELFFFKQIFSPNDYYPIDYDESIVSLLYRQQIDDLKSGKFENISPQKTALIAIFQMKIDHFGAPLTPENIENIHALISEKRTENLKDQINIYVEEVEKKGLLSIHDWQCMLIKEISDELLFGSAIFYGKTLINEVNIENSHIIGFNILNILILDNQLNKIFIFPIEDVVDFNIKGNCFIFKVQNGDSFQFIPYRGRSHSCFDVFRHYQKDINVGLTEDNKKAQYFQAVENLSGVSDVDKKRITKRRTRSIGSLSMFNEISARRGVGRNEKSISLDKKQLESFHRDILKFSPEFPTINYKGEFFSIFNLFSETIFCSTRMDIAPNIQQYFMKNYSREQIKVISTIDNINLGNFNLISIPFFSFEVLPLQKIYHICDELTLFLAKNPNNIVIFFGDDEVDRSIFFGLCLHCLVAPFATYNKLLKYVNDIKKKMNFFEKTPMISNSQQNYLHYVFQMVKSKILHINRTDDSITLTKISLPFFNDCDKYNDINITIQCINEDSSINSTQTFKIPTPTLSAPSIITDLNMSLFNDVRVYGFNNTGEVSDPLFRFWFHMKFFNEPEITFDPSLIDSYDGVAPITINFFFDEESFEALDAFN